MRKFTAFLVLNFVFCFIGLKAQHITNYISSEYPNTDTTFYFEEAFVELDTSSYLTTGFLWDRTSPNIPLHLYDGSSSAEVSVDPKTLIQGYLDIVGSCVQTSSMPSDDSLLNLNQKLILGYDAIPISVIDLKVSRIKADAFNLGLLDFIGGVLKASGTGNPFEEIDVFLAGLLNQTFPVNEPFNIVAPYILYCGTNDQNVESIRINMNDGNGWQSLIWNQPKSFTLTGEDGEFDFEIEVTYKDQSVKISKNKGYKKSSGCTVIPPEEAPWGGETVTFNVPYLNKPNKLLSGNLQYIQYNRYVNHYLSSTDLTGGHGKVYVRYRSGAPTSQPKNFAKPVIVVEGIDFGLAIPIVYEPLPSLSINNINQGAVNFSNTTRLGSFGWPEMFGCNSDEYPNEKMPDFVDSLYNNDNDLIFLDFRNGADYIQRNGKLLMELIRRVNQYKIGNEEIVILGVSMGGQVTRYALSQMEANVEEHCVRLFVSHDSPWLGANIPPSIQFFVKYFAESHNNSHALEFKRMLNTPAAKQLLLYHFSNKGNNPNEYDHDKIWDHHYGFNGNGNHSARQAFLNELATIGNFPRQCRNIAIASGNSDGTIKFSDGTGLYGLNSSCGGYDIKINLYALNRSDALVAEMDHPFTWKYRYFLYGLTNLSGVPGGGRIDLQKLQPAIESAKPWYCSGVTVPGPLQDFFTFVPTLSALNISGVPWDAKATDYSDKLDASAMDNTHFEVYYAPDSTDEFHGEVTDENIIWLMKRIHPTNYSRRHLKIILRKGSEERARKVC